MRGTMATESLAFMDEQTKITMELLHEIYRPLQQKWP
jgi:hypothetical protein